MRLSKPLLQLPIRFDADRLAAEVNALPASAWLPHPTGFVGNEAVPLVSPGGLPNDDFDGPMAPTEALKQLPYVMDLMADLGCVWGRSRLMALAAGADVPIHIDVHYHWRTHRRLHIPVVTNPGVLFTVNNETVHMEAGECWLFDSFSLHKVQNKGSERRIHLVLDTVGGQKLWDLVEAASTLDPREAAVWDGKPGRPLAFEQFNRPKVMSPWEMKQHIDYVLDHAPPEARMGAVAMRLDRFLSGWHAAWAQFGTSDEGLPAYQALIQQMRAELTSLNAQQVKLQNEQGLGFVLDALVLWNAVAPPSMPPRIQ
ncbi:aspartyl/asparaginyl beta-hydroxylase domain-containing protein [Sphingomonas sp. NSE70-1]|uniref:Aspartyl/asparaginyl beta-hydroxylase domain-containing protein n=1 Tax=Sphingomonas caseinilyticus TaxID=2908205 RepID=A0ABT0RSW5_9SPHN|nr:aspartyl/asparaginyl beta-hydroxylase domain-containing protein [Sphingomonas caseinilyticus]MCL6698016.1 aspartyl/asparaginyl beta-hydroxylase domain-containing protein [Sphingomonas caseinilyticus]